MISIFSFEFLLVVINLFPLVSYIILLSYFSNIFFSNLKKTQIIGLFCGAAYIFIFKYILFENKDFWSEIYPYFLLLFILTKFIFLRKILRLSTLIFFLTVSVVYPTTYILNVIDMAYNPYIIFVYHSFWVSIFIYCAKKIVTPA